MKKQTTGVYLLKNNKILFLVRQKKNDTRHLQGIYLPIGGHVEDGEEIETAAVREVEEESGIKVNSLDLKGVVNILGQATGENDITMFLFTSDDFVGDPKAGSEGTFEWVDQQDLNRINLYEGDKIFWQYLFDYQFFVLDFHYKGFKFISYKELKIIK
jgi:8-oxo-dGTP diphosphatase